MFGPVNSVRYAVFFAMSLMTAVPVRGGNPRIFYSDLDSGPNSGGEKNGGAYVTIYGKGFGATQGASFVTIGAGRAVAYPVWTDSKIAFQIGASAASGDVIVNSGAGVSNTVPFTVRTGRILFVAAGGKDAGNGSSASPWRTITKARDSMKAGDIVYVRDGVSQSTDDGAGWSSCLTLGGNAGTAGNPKALVVYPGESATIGSVNTSKANGCDTGIRTKGQGEGYWTIAGFVIRGAGLAISTAGVTNWRLVGNDMSCPNGNGQAGCLTTGYNSTYLYIYGNTVHHVATSLNPANVTALYHGVYFADGTAHVWFGWNTIADVQGCRGIQQNASAGTDAFDLHIHDNVIHDTQCDGIVMTTVDPSKGPVELYNNIIYNAGKGPNNAEKTGAWSCMNLQGYDVGGPGTGVIEVYNNTMYSCGTFQNPPYDGSAAGLLWVAGKNSDKYVHIRNNIFYTPKGVPYVHIYSPKGVCRDTDNCNNVRGSNNLFFGNGAAPRNSNITGSINQDPMFVNLSQKDFHLTEASPARRAGVNVGAVADMDGNPPSTGASGRDVGAFQFLGPIQHP
jgi:hypothetical protein